MSTFTRITKAEARKRYENNEALVFCPSNLRPGFPFASHAKLFPETHKPEGYPELWETFDQVYNAWAYYNTSYEAGYYAHYYIESD